MKTDNPRISVTRWLGAVLILLALVLSACASTQPVDISAPEGTEAPDTSDAPEPTEAPDEPQPTEAPESPDDSSAPAEESDGIPPEVLWIVLGVVAVLLVGFLMGRSGRSTEASEQPPADTYEPPEEPGSSDEPPTDV